MSLPLPSPPKKISRPPNAFFIYRSFISGLLTPPPAGTTRNQTDVSKLAGEMWRNETAEVKDEFLRKAEVAKAEHAAQYPDHKFVKTSRKGKGGSKKGRSTRGEVVVDAPGPVYTSNYQAVGGSQGLHHSSAVLEHSGSDYGVAPQHHVGFDYPPPLVDQSVFSCDAGNAWLTNEALVLPQTVFVDEQEFFEMLQDLSFEQLLEINLSA